MFGAVFFHPLCGGEVRERERVGWFVDRGGGEGRSEGRGDGGRARGGGGAMLSGREILLRSGTIECSERVADLDI